MKTNPNWENRQLKIISPRVIALGLLAGTLLAMCLSGCRGSSPADPGTVASLTGNYTLVSVNGQPVPCVVSHEGHDVTVKTGAFSINADGTCHSESIFAVEHYADVHRVVDASYTTSGTELTMRWKGAGVTKGSVDGNTFTMNNEGMIFVYRK